MARARVGGTKSLLSGKVGDFIYSITRDARGNFRQQVASNPEQRFNPNTDGQARARCAMGTIERAMFTFADFITSGWEGIENGTMALQEFSRVNYRFIQEQLDQFWDEPDAWDAPFDLPKKGQVSPRAGLFQISRGSLVVPMVFTRRFPHSANVGVQLVSLRTPARCSLRDWLRHNGMSLGEEWTFIQFIEGSTPSKSVLSWIDLRTDITQSPEQVLTAANFRDVLHIKSNLPLNVYMVSGTTQIVMEFLNGAAWGLRGVSVYGHRVRSVSGGRLRYNNCVLQPYDAWAGYNSTWQSLAQVKSSWLNATEL